MLRAFRARLAALHLSGWPCVFRQSVWGKTPAVKHPIPSQGALHGKGLPTSSRLWKSGRGLKASKDFQRAPVWTHQCVYSPHMASAPLGPSQGKGASTTHPALSILGKSSISAVPGPRVYGLLPKYVSTGYSIMLPTAERSRLITLSYMHCNYPITDVGVWRKRSERQL